MGFAAAERHRPDRGAEPRPDTRDADRDAFPQSAAVAGTSYRVLIDVVRFESTPGKNATLDALWTVRCTKDGRTRSGRTTLIKPVVDKSYPTLVAAHSHALGRLSNEVAGAIRALESDGP